VTQETTSEQPSLHPFVGRKRELEELRAGLNNATAGRGRLFLLSGEPGIGKTRLAEEISNYASALGMGVLWGRCWEGGGAPAYWPLIQILRTAFADRDNEQLQKLLGPNATEIARLIPEIKTCLPALEVPRATTDSESARFLLFDSVATLLKTLARTEPLLLVVDDLQDADQPSLQMLRFIARAAKDAPLLILGTYRDAEVKRSSQLGKLVGDLIREGHLLPLTGLSKVEVGDFIESRTGRPAADKLVADLYHVTDGNALYVEATVRLLKLDENLGRAANDRDGFKIPDGVRESIRRQLDTLSEEANSLLAIASVIGTEFDMRLLERVSGNSAELIVDRMEEAARIGILTSPTPGYAQCRFSHALIRGVLYEELTAKKRIQLHGEIGTALEDTHKSDLKPHWAELAHHFTQAGVRAKAIDCWIEAGQAAYSVFGFEEAASCWRAALGMTEQQRTDPLLLARVHERLGDLTMAGDAGPSETLAHLEAALRTYQALGDTRRTARVHIHLGNLMSTNLAALDIPTALGHFRKAEALINRFPEDALLGFLYGGFGAAAREAMQTKEGLRTSDCSMQIAQRLGNDVLWINAAALHSDLLLNAGRIREALALADEAYIKADALNEAGVACTAAVVRGANYTQLLDPCQAESCISRELRKARLKQSPQLRDSLLFWLEAAHLRKGELHDSERPRIEGRTDSFTEGKRRIFSGEWELAGSEIARSLKYARRAGSRDATARLMFYAARISRLTGQLGEGVTQLRESLSLCSDDLNSLCEMEARPELSLLLVELQSLSEAQLHLARCREIMAEGEDWRGLAGSVACAEGVVAAAEGKYEDAETKFGRAIEIFREYQGPFDEAEVLYNWGRALNKSGERERANDKLDAAVEIYRRCGAGERWVERVEAVRAPAATLQSLPAEGTGQQKQAQNEGVFQREGDIWTITYEGQTLRLRDFKGLSYIACLLQHPGEEFHAASLATGVDSANSSEDSEARSELGAMTREQLAERNLRAGAPEDAGEMLDAQAKAAYRRKLEELREELEEAREFRNPERIAKAEDEIEALSKELSRAIGRRGRHRRAGSTPERARLSVTNAIKVAIEQVARKHSGLAAHLTASIRTGTYCCYRPDPKSNTVWHF
jgi:tetratricopeptide (TPR) repeat protein